MITLLIVIWVILLYFIIFFIEKFAKSFDSLDDEYNKRYLLFFILFSLILAIIFKFTSNFWLYEKVYINKEMIINVIFLWTISFYFKYKHESKALTLSSYKYYFDKRLLFYINKIINKIIFAEQIFILTILMLIIKNLFRLNHIVYNWSLSLFYSMYFLNFLIIIYLIIKEKNVEKQLLN